MRDQWVRALAHDGAVRVVLVVATAAAQHTAKVHGLGPGAARLGAEVLVAGLLMGAHIKGEERVTLQLQASAPRASAAVEVGVSGVVRARVSPPDAELREAYEGVMLAIKDDLSGELYRGFTAVRDQSVADALHAHLAESSQVDARLAIAVEMVDGAVDFVAGLLVERLPFEEGRPSLTDEAFAARFDNLALVDVHRALFGKIRGAEVVSLASGDITWRCRCTSDRVEAMLVGLGKETLRTLREEDGGAEITCHFCAHPYLISAERLAVLGGAVAEGAEA